MMSAAQKLAQKWLDAVKAVGNRTAILDQIAAEAQAAQETPPAAQQTPVAPAVVPPAPPAPAARAPEARPVLTPKDFPKAVAAVRLQVAGPEHMQADRHQLTSQQAVLDGTYGQHREQLLATVPGYKTLWKHEERAQGWRANTDHRSRAHAEAMARAQTPPQATTTGVFAGGLVQPTGSAPPTPPAPPPVEVVGDLTIPHGHRMTGKIPPLLAKKYERMRMLKLAKKGESHG